MRGVVFLQRKVGNKGLDGHVSKVGVLYCKIYMLSTSTKKSRSLGERDLVYVEILGLKFPLDLLGLGCIVPFGSQPYVLPMVL